MIEQLVADWLADAQDEIATQSLLEVVNGEINRSRRRVRAKMDALAERKKLRDLESNISAATAILTESNRVQADADEYLNRLEQDLVPVLSLPLANLSQDISCIEQFRDVFNKVDDMKKLHILFDVLVKAYKDEHFKVAVDKLRTIQELIYKTINNNDNTSFDQEIDELLRVMQSDLHSVEKDMKRTFSESIKKMFKVDCDEHAKTVSLTVDTVNLDELVIALANLKLLDKLMNEVFESLTRQVIDKIYGGSTAEVVDDNRLVVRTGKSSSVIEVAENIKLLFNFLAPKFAANDTLKKMFRRFGKEHFERVTAFLLDKAQPGQNNTAITTEIESLQQYFVDLDLLDPADITNVSGSVNSTVLTRVCDGYLLEARSIVRDSELDFEVVKLTETDLVPQLDEQLDYEVQEVLQDFTTSAFQVHNFVIRFKQLVLQMCREPEENFSGIVAPFYSNARDAICLFLYVPPVKHTQLVYDIPKQSAVFYNDCVFLSNFLAHLHKKFADKMPEEEVNFADLRTRLHNMAESILDEQLKKQEMIIIEFFQQPQVLQSIIDNTSRNENILRPFEMAVAQSLKHMTTLRGCWFDVFAQRTLNRAIGRLLDCMLGQFIDKISLLEDISAASATRIAEIMTKVAADWRSLFRDLDEDLSGLTPKCFAFSELKFVLQANLKEIVDRWAEGYGPLATAFKPEVVKRLIRALFQNSERRAQALSMIR